MARLTLLLLALVSHLCNTSGNTDTSNDPVPNDTYVCEKDEVVTLRCQNNENINVKKVLYGRQRMDKCNDNKRRLPSDCYSQSATSIVMRLCHDKRECFFTAARLFDRSRRILADLPAAARHRCVHPRGRDSALIRYVCRAPTPPPTTPSPTPAWRIKTSPREGRLTVVSGSTVRLSCMCYFTNLNANTETIEVRWTDFEKGNQIYSSSNRMQMIADKRMSVKVTRQTDRIQTWLTIKNVTRAVDSDHRIFDCTFTQINVKSINDRLRIEILPPTPPPSTPTTVPTTTPAVERKEPLRKRLWTRDRCHAVKKAGYKLCQTGSKCFDFGATITCRCSEGFSGSGLIRGACEEMPDSIRLNGKGAPWVCPKYEQQNSECISTDIKNMKDKVAVMDLKGKLETFRNFTQKKDMTVDELVAVGHMLEVVVENAVKGDPEANLLEPTYFPRIVVRSTSNLLSRRDLWKRMPSQHTRRSLATSFTKMVTDTCLASTLGADKPLEIDDTFVDVKVMPVTGAAKQLMFRPGGATGDSMKLELQNVGRYSTNQPRVVFTRFKAIGDDFTPEKTANASGPKLRVLSEVVSATASDEGLVKKIAFQLVHKSVKELVNGTKADRKCAYWNEQNLTWAFDGCRVANMSDLSVTACECDHLTSFAVLLDFGNVTGALPEVHQLTLSIITYVGCCLSIFCCIFGVWTYDILRRSKGDRMNSEGRTSFFIYEMICFSLLVAQTIFLMGIFHTSILIVCRLVAALLHYFFLLLFEWMLVAGVYYILVYTQPYSIATVDSHRGWLVLVIFLAPAIIVGVSLGLRLEGYGTSTHCWLSVADGLIWAFVGPVTAMLSINMVLLAVLIVLTWRIKPSEMLETGEVNKTWVTTRALKLRYELLFCIVLGATWIFGYFLIENNTSLVFSYIFAILNSLQGVFILISYANWSRIRAAYIAEFRRKRWLPESFRRWLHSRQYSPGGPPGVGLAGSSGTPSQRRTSSRASNSQRGLLVGTGGPHGSDSAQLSRTTRSTRLGSGSSTQQKWSVSAGSPHGLDANDNSVAMVTETEAAFNENYLGHSMMDEPRQTYVDFDERFVSQSDAEIINMTAALPLREHEEDGEHQHRYSSSSTSSSSSSVASVPSTPPSSFSGPVGPQVASPHDSLAREPPKLPVVCAVPSPFTGGTPAKEAAAAAHQPAAHVAHPTPHVAHQPPHVAHQPVPHVAHQPPHVAHQPVPHVAHQPVPHVAHQPPHVAHPPPHHFTPVLGSATVPRPVGGYQEEEENDYLVPNAGSAAGIASHRHTLDCRAARRREDQEVRAAVSAKQKRFSQSDLYANADDVVYYSQPPLEPHLPPDHPRQGPSRVTNV